MLRKERGQSVKQKQVKQAQLDPQHLKVEFAGYDFPNCSYAINRTCQYPMLIK